MIQTYQVEGATASAIAACIERGVRCGGIAPGAKIPSVRALAAGLGVSPTTVVAALTELRRRGIVVSEQRRGSRVSQRPPLSTRGVLPLPAGARDLARGNPDPALLPGLGAALRNVQIPTRLYGAEPIVPELVELVRGLCAKSHIPADNICVVGGALDGIERVLSAHLVAGDRVAIEDPGYSALLDLVRTLGLEVVPMPVDESGPLPDSLEAILPRVRAVVVTPRAQNPTGAAVSAERATDLRRVLRRDVRVVVVEDDHLGALAGRPHHTLTDENRPWAVIQSVAKSLGPDLRVAFLAGDATTVARVAGRQLVGTGWVSHLLQRVVVSLYASSDVQTLLQLAERTYDERRTNLVNELRARGIASTGVSGMNVWIPVREESLTIRGLLERGWAVAAGELYRIASPPAIRVTTAALACDDTARFANDLAETLSTSFYTRIG